LQGRFKIGDVKTPSAIQVEIFSSFNGRIDKFNAGNFIDPG